MLLTKEIVKKIMVVTLMCMGLFLSDNTAFAAAVPTKPSLSLPLSIGSPFPLGDYLFNGNEEEDLGFYADLGDIVDLNKVLSSPRHASADHFESHPSDQFRLYEQEEEPKPQIQPQAPMQFQALLQPQAQLQGVHIQNFMRPLGDNAPLGDTVMMRQAPQQSLQAPSFSRPSSMSPLTSPASTSHEMRDEDEGDDEEAVVDADPNKEEEESASPKAKSKKQTHQFQPSYISNLLHSPEWCKGARDFFLKPNDPKRAMDGSVQFLSEIIHNPKLVDVSEDQREQWEKKGFFDRLEKFKKDKNGKTWKAFEAAALQYKTRQRKVVVKTKKKHNFSLDEQYWYENLSQFFTPEGENKPSVGALPFSRRMAQNPEDDIYEKNSSFVDILKNIKKTNPNIWDAFENLVRKRLNKRKPKPIT
jgi:hypothetical protein